MAKYLAGPFNLETYPWIRDWFKGEEALLFGSRADIDYSKAGESFQEILSRVPAGANPEYLLYFFPENNCIPPGIESSPLPVIAVISDWSINLESLAKIAPFFSYLIVDSS